MRLGQGVYDAIITDRGGSTILGRVDNVTRGWFNRVRDDISTATVQVQAPNAECAALLAQARTVRHELVILRNGERVWEGPITRLTYSQGRAEINASDVLWYASRSVLANGYNYVGQRGKPLLQMLDDALRQAYGQPDGTGDPNGFNVGRYIRVIYGPDDPDTAAQIEPYSRTAWELLDNMAEDAGIDYVAVGRSVYLWDVHTRASVATGILTDASFTQALEVTEYGSELATRRFRTDNEGNVTQAIAPQQWIDYYGNIDTVASNVDEEAGPTVPGVPVMADLKMQYPAPLHIMAPAGIPLDCDAPINFDQLIPGTWIEVHATKTIRPVRNWMKLQEVTVNFGDGGAGNEVVAVSLIQAPSDYVDLVTP
jgi:hypothetical protein